MPPVVVNKMPVLKKKLSSINPLVDVAQTPSAVSKLSRQDREREKRELQKKMFPDPLDPIHKEF